MVDNKELAAKVLHEIRVNLRGRHAEGSFIIDKATGFVNYFTLGRDLEVSGDEEVRILTLDSGLALIYTAEAPTILAAVLKAYREAIDYTQLMVACIVDVNIRLYQKWEAGEIVPSTRSMIRLVRALAIPDYWIERAFDLQK